MCPSQWEGKLTDGRMFYARYRHGKLRISISKEPTDDVYDAFEEVIINEPIGGMYSGIMTENGLIHIMEKSGFEFPRDFKNKNSIKAKKKLSS